MNTETKIREALLGAKSAQETNLDRAMKIRNLEEDLESMRLGENCDAQEIDSKCNGLLIANASKVLRALLENDAVREYVEKNMGSDGYVAIGDKEIFINLAEFCPEVPEVEVHPSLIIYGPSRPKNNFQLVLHVHRSQENGNEWDYSTVQYCICSTNEISMDDWMNANPINLAPAIARALLYLQTPETAIQILVEQFHGTAKKKVGHKESHPLKLPKKMFEKKEGGKKS